MPTVIDQDEHVKNLTINALDTLTIEHDKGSPKGDKDIRVSANGISVGLGATVLIQHHASLTLTGLVAANVLGNIDIGNNGSLALKSSIGAGLLSNINFVATAGTARLVIDTSKVQITGNINGFGAHDNIQLLNMSAASAVWTQGLLNEGSLALYNAAGTEVGSLGLTGQYTTADFALKDFTGPDGHASTRIGFVAPAEHGFQVPAAAQETAAAAAVSSGSVRDLHVQDAMVAAHFTHALHQG